MVYNKKKYSPLRLAKIEKSLGSFKAMSDYMIRLSVLLKSGRMVMNIPILRRLSTHGEHI